MWKDFKWVEKRFGTKFANILKGFDKGSKEIEEHFTTKENHEVTFTDANGVQNTLVTEQGISEVLAKNGLIEVKWQELKDKRDNGELIPGSLYRITDYNCTTTQENTRSAGHQFDIVLLALSENKLAEEGWAMMNESNIYDVTYTPDVGQEPVTAKGYLYNYLSPEEPEYSIVLCDTLKGGSGLDGSEFTIDEENKTIVFNSDFYASMNVENLTYNYFQNSNLSAWKVWYCLDNDKSRFAWAQVETEIPADITSVVGENETTYVSSGDSIMVNGVSYDKWTIAEQPWTVRVFQDDIQIGAGIYVVSNNGGWTITSQETTVSSINGTPAQVIPEGTGVIYRLIDEWNNDVAYDFKNIQFKRPISGENTWVYTYTWYDLDKNIAVDTSLDGGMMDGFIGIYNGTDSIYELSNNVIANPSGYSIKLVGTSGYCTISASSGLLLYNCDSLEIEGVDDAIYVAGKKVLTEE